MAQNGLTKTNLSFESDLVKWKVMQTNRFFNVTTNGFSCHKKWVFNVAKNELFKWIFYFKNNVICRKFWIFQQSAFLIRHCNRLCDKLTFLNCACEILATSKSYTWPTNLLCDFFWTGKFSLTVFLCQMFLHAFLSIRVLYLAFSLYRTELSVGVTVLSWFYWLEDFDSQTFGFSTLTLYSEFFIHWLMLPGSLEVCISKFAFFTCLFSCGFAGPS